MKSYIVASCFDLLFTWRLTRTYGDIEQNYAAEAYTLELWKMILFKTLAVLIVILAMIALKQLPTKLYPNAGIWHKRITFLAIGITSLVATYGAILYGYFSWTY